MQNSELFRTFFLDRRCWLLVLTTALAGCLGFYAIPDSVAITLVSRTGFWFVLVTLIIWVEALRRTLLPFKIAWREIDWLALSVIGASTVVLLVHETAGFKIIMDEIMLLGTSMSMHLDKLALTPLRGNDIQGAFVILDGIVDKRPLFFPTLLSLVHDIAGYRPSNVFVLNGVLTLLFLWLIYVAGRRVAGRSGAMLGVILFAGLPLLAHNSTGGGFELLNLTMIVATFLLGIRWVEKADPASMVAFVFSGLLLAQVRYESVIFLLPVAVLVLMVWFREGRAIVPWAVIAAPLLMVHYPLQNRIFDLRASAWEMASKPGYTSPFSLSYIPEGLSHAAKFFFAGPTDQPNSIVLSALGVVAIPFFVLLVLKRLRGFRTESAPAVVVTIFSVGFLIHFALMMSYAWGFDEVVTRRLSLPTHLGMVLAIFAILPQFKNPTVIRVLLAVSVVGLLCRSIPSMAAHAYSQEYLPAREVAWRRAFMRDQPRPDYLMIDNDSILWITHQISATPTVVAAKRREDIAFHMRNRTFSGVYVFQRVNIDAETGRERFRDGDDLGPAFVLETVAEERLQVLTISRISRVKEIRTGDVAISHRDSVTEDSTKTRAEIEKARHQFLESYMKQLP